MFVYVTSGQIGSNFGHFDFGSQQTRPILAILVVDMSDDVTKLVGDETWLISVQEASRRGECCFLLLSLLPLLLDFSCPRGGNEIQPFSGPTDFLGAVRSHGSNTNRIHKIRITSETVRGRSYEHHHPVVWIYACTIYPPLLDARR